VSGPTGAQAQSQAGGLPAVSDQVSRLEGVATTLQTAVTTLTTQVTTLRTTVTTLQTDNVDLQSALTAEIAARQAADDALHTLLFQEVVNRAKGDLDLGARISNVEALVGAGASGKFFQIRTTGSLVNGARATVATLGPLPPGNYLVIGRVDVENFDHDALRICSLQHPSELLVIDASQTSTRSVGLTGSPLASITMAGIARLTVSDPVTMDCESGESGSDLGDIRLLAVQIGLPG